MQIAFIRSIPQHNPNNFFSLFFYLIFASFIKSHKPSITSLCNSLITDISY